MKRPWHWHLRRFSESVFERLSRVPLGVWAALGAAFVLFELYVRGRRLDANLAQEKLRHVVAEARANLARNEFREEQHLDRVKAAQHRIEEIETARALVTATGAKEARRLRTLDSKKVHQEYMKLLMKKWDKMTPDPSFNVEPMGKITVRPRPRKPEEEPPTSTEKE